MRCPPLFVFWFNHLLVIAKQIVHILVALYFMGRIILLLDGRAHNCVSRGIGCLLIETDVGFIEGSCETGHVGLRRTSSGSVASKYGKWYYDPSHMSVEAVRCRLMSDSSQNRTKSVRKGTLFHFGLLAPVKHPMSSSLFWNSPR